MKRLFLGAAATGGAAFALQLARKAHAMHGHCREMMRNNCGAWSAGCQPN